MEKKVLVTGAAGFIGYHLCHFLKQRGDEVFGLDNFNNYYDPRLKKARASVLAQAGINLVQGDVCDKELLGELLDKHKITHLAHLAAQAGVRYSLVNPDAYITSNINGFLNILEACRKRRDISLVYASSSSVYGLNSKIPFSVSDSTDLQASLYGVTKKTNELMAKTYHHLYGIHVTGLRFFTVYGPWGRPDMAYYSFTKKILAGQPIDVYNFGRLQRDFTYIDDIIAGAAAAIDLGASCETFNLGNNRPVELGRFIEIIEQTLGMTAVKNYLPMQSGDVLTTYADLSHSAAQLGYRSKTPLEQGIPKFIEWYRTYHH